MAKGSKTGGRKKGVPNRKTKRELEIMDEVLGRELESGRLQSEIDKLEGEEYLNFMLRLMEYVVPKATDQNTATNNRFDAETLFGVLHKN